MKNHIRFQTHATENWKADIPHQQPLYLWNYYLKMDSNNINLVCLTGFFLHIRKILYMLVPMKALFLKEKVIHKFLFSRQLAVSKGHYKTVINTVERRNSILVHVDLMTEDWLNTWLIGGNHTISFQFYVTGELQKWEPKKKLRALCVFMFKIGGEI